jgi:hypothetical protein
LRPASASAQAVEDLRCFCVRPNDEYWYAFGRIAKEFGENQIAETEYKKLKKPKEESSLPTSTYTLAQKRLRQMREAQRLGPPQAAS